MTDSEWADWIKKFVSVFGVTAATEIGMLRAWREVFGKLGYTAAELHEALIHATAEKVYKFDDYLRIMRARIDSERLRQARAEMNLRQAQAFEDAEQQKPFSGCEHCRNERWVIVPHPKHIRNGEWNSPWITAAVICDRCEKGRQWKAGIDAKEPVAGFPLTLSRYEELFPDWRVMTAEANGIRESLREATESARRADARNAKAKPEALTDGIGNMPKQAKRDTKSIPSGPKST